MPTGRGCSNWRSASTRQDEVYGKDRWASQWRTAGWKLWCTPLVPWKAEQKLLIESRSRVEPLVPFQVVLWVGGDWFKNGHIDQRCHQDEQRQQSVTPPVNEQGFNAETTKGPATHQKKVMVPSSKNSTSTGEIPASFIFVVFSLRQSWAVVGSSATVLAAFFALRFDGEGLAGGAIVYQPRDAVSSRRLPIFTNLRVPRHWRSSVPWRAEKQIEQRRMRRPAIDLWRGGELIPMLTGVFT